MVFVGRIESQTGFPFLLQTQFVKAVTVGQTPKFRGFRDDLSKKFPQKKVPCLNACIEANGMTFTVSGVQILKLLVYEEILQSRNEKKKRLRFSVEIPSLLFFAE